MIDLYVGRRALAKIRLFSSLPQSLYFAGPCVFPMHIDTASWLGKRTLKSWSLLGCTHLASAILTLAPTIIRASGVGLSPGQDHHFHWELSWDMVSPHIQGQWVKLFWPQQHSLPLPGRTSTPTKLGRWRWKQEYQDCHSSYLKFNSSWSIHSQIVVLHSSEMVMFSVFLF